jgi:serine/threonine-protein kinase RsbW
MPALRATAKAYAMQQPGPATVLARLDQYMDRQGPDELATLWYGEYRAGSGMLAYASAGHPPPAVIAHVGAPLGALYDETAWPRYQHTQDQAAA